MTSFATLCSCVAKNAGAEFLVSLDSAPVEVPPLASLPRLPGGKDGRESRKAAVGRRKV
jgi:hypothetical protein